MSFKVEGLDDFQRTLRDLKRRAQELDGEHEVSFEELFSDAFMRKYTDYGSIDKLVEASGFKVQSQEDFAAIPDDEWDAFIRKSTRFSSWKEMMETATSEYVAKELGLK